MAEPEATRFEATETPADAEPSWLGPPAQGDGTCRGGYGRAVVAHFGSACAYCGRDLAASYENWLDLSVDHVVPRNAVREGVKAEWIEDILNHVTCCRACNEFLNGYRVKAAMPSDIAAFLQLRDEILEEKRARARERHDLERQRFNAWIEERAAGS